MAAYTKRNVRGRYMLGDQDSKKRTGILVVILHLPSQDLRPQKAEFDRQ